MFEVDWLSLNQSYFKKKQIYKMQWGSVDLSRFLCAVAEHGGPIGTWLSS